MVDEPRVLEARHGVMTAIAGDVARLVAAVAEDVGETPEAVRPVVELTLRLLLDQPGLAKGRAIMRVAGAQAARDGIPAERYLQRFTSTTWLIWEAARAHPATDRAVLENVGQTLLRGIDLLVGAVADGYNAVDRETVAHDAEMRRALLEDILSTAPADPVAAARRRRTADRYGLDPDDLYRVVAVADRRDGHGCLDRGRRPRARDAVSAGRRGRAGRPPRSRCPRSSSGATSSSSSPGHRGRPATGCPSISTTCSARAGWRSPATRSPVSRASPPRWAG